MSQPWAVIGPGEVVILAPESLPELLMAVRLVARGVPVAVCAPATRARWATGSGKADKAAAVAAAVARLWPTAALVNADVVDALAIATAGAQRLGWAVPTLARHTDALAAITWPAAAVEEVTVSG